MVPYKFAMCIIIALAGVIKANQTANLFIDQVMADMRFQAAYGVDPARVTPFQIKVKGNGITNRDFKANFTQGSMFGLSTLSRVGECTYGAFGYGMKIGCYVKLDVKFAMNADVKGDNILGRIHSISTLSTVLPNSLVLVEFIGKRGGPISLDNVILRPVNITTIVTNGQLDLNKARHKSFINEVNQQLTLQLNVLIDTVYTAALNGILSHRLMP